MDALNLSSLVGTRDLEFGLRAISDLTLKLCAVSNYIPSRTPSPSSSLQVLSQFSTISPGILSNSLALLVTSEIDRLLA